MTYTIVRVAVQEDLATTLAAHIRSNLAEVASLALLLNLQCFLGHLVGEQAGGVLPPAQNEGSVCLLGIDDSLLDLLVDGSLDSAHEASTHIDTLSAESKSSRKTLTISETTRSNKRNTQALACTAQKNEVGDIVLADMAGALETVNGEEVNAQLDSGFGVADGSALVEDDCAGLLELLDDGARVVAGGLDDLDSFIDDDLCVGAVVWGHHGGEEGQVDTEGVFGHSAASSDFLAQVFRGRLSESSQLDVDVSLRA